MVIDDAQGVYAIGSGVVRAHSLARSLFLVLFKSNEILAVM